MIRALILALAASLALPSPAAFAEAAAKAAQGESARAMDVMNLEAPVVRDGRLVNYLFINARIQLAPGVDVFRTREKGHFLRDALLKAVHRRSVAVADRDDTLDRAAAIALITATARQTLGDNAIRSVEILSVSSLRQGRAARS
jgi:hypothetical protein